LTPVTSAYRDTDELFCIFENPTARNKAADEVGRQRFSPPESCAGSRENRQETIFANEQRTKEKARTRRALKMRGIIQGVSIRGFQGRRALKLVTLP
jgi:hypothetical protein